MPDSENVIGEGRTEGSDEAATRTEGKTIPAPDELPTSVLCEEKYELTAVEIN